MEKDRVKRLIVDYINEVGGCKATDLITELPVTLTNHEDLIALGELDISIIVAELVTEKCLIEIGYLLPIKETWRNPSAEELEERLKKHERSFLIPAGCEVVIKGDRKN